MGLSFDVLKNTEQQSDGEQPAKVLDNAVQRHDDTPRRDENPNVDGWP
jgi:hypothetical protein